MGASAQSKSKNKNEKSNEKISEDDLETKEDRKLFILHCQEIIVMMNSNETERILMHQTKPFNVQSENVNYVSPFPSVTLIEQLDIKKKDLLISQEREKIIFSLTNIFTIILKSWHLDAFVCLLLLKKKNNNNYTIHFANYPSRNLYFENYRVIISS